MSWGKGGMTGVGKAIWQHERTQALAAAILEQECGVKHETGTHALCPKCEAARFRVRTTEGAPTDQEDVG